MIESGGFDEDSHIELLEGLLVRMSPRTREHENAIEWLNDWLMFRIDRKHYKVRVASSLTLDDSEPEPDLAVIPVGVARPYHPATASLVVEVAVSSLRRDLMQKTTPYARAGVLEYWVIDLAGRRAVVHRRPGDDGYAESFVVGAGDELTAASVELPPLELGELLRAAGA